MRVSDDLLTNAANGYTNQLVNGDVVSIANELVDARTLIAAFERMLDGGRELTFAGYENANGENVGDAIEAARVEYNNR